jgi:hypothetical protein
MGAKASSREDSTLVAASGRACLGVDYAKPFSATDGSLKRRNRISNGERCSRSFAGTCGTIVRPVGAHASPKPKRGSQPVPSLALRVSVSAHANGSFWAACGISGNSRNRFRGIPSDGLLGVAKRSGLIAEGNGRWTVGANNVICYAKYAKLRGLGVTFIRARLRGESPHDAKLTQNAAELGATCSHMTDGDASLANLLVVTSSPCSPGFCETLPRFVDLIMIKACAHPAIFAEDSRRSQHLSAASSWIKSCGGEKRRCFVGAIGATDGRPMQHETCEERGRPGGTPDKPGETLQKPGKTRRI